MYTAQMCSWDATALRNKMQQYNRSLTALPLVVSLWHLMSPTATHLCNCKIATKHMWYSQAFGGLVGGGRSNDDSNAAATAAAMSVIADPEAAVEQLRRMVTGDEGWADVEPNEYLARRLGRMPDEV